MCRMFFPRIPPVSEPPVFMPNERQAMNLNYYDGIIARCEAELARLYSEKYPALHKAGKEH